MAADCVVGVDLGGTRLRAGAVDRDLAVHHRVVRRAAAREPGELLDLCVEAVDEAREAAGSEVAGVGFGIPSLIDQRRGVAVMAVNLPLLDVRFGDVMTERLGVPVWVDNDANVALLAEHRHGAAAGASEAVMLTVGTGIGGGLVLGGRLYRGATGAAAELGHMVIEADGPRCQGNCPSRGCLEAVASGTALAREARRLAHERPDSGLGRALAGGREISGALVGELAHDGDPAARAALELVGRRLGVGISNLVNIFNPEVVVLGGGVLGAGELLLAPARREMAARALRPSRDQARVVPARFGGEAGMLGAAVLAFERLEGGRP
jgi:glucokinase